MHDTIDVVCDMMIGYQVMWVKYDVLKTLLSGCNVTITTILPTHIIISDSSIHILPPTNSSFLFRQVLGEKKYKTLLWTNLKKSSILFIVMCKGSVKIYNTN